MSRKILVNSNTYHGYSIDEAIEGIADAGYKYIELTATKGWTEHVFVDKTFYELQRIKDKLEEFNLIPLAMSGHTSLMDNSRLGAFINNIHLANFYNCKYIVTSVGEAHLEDVVNEGNDLVVKNLKEFIPLLEKYDMTLVVEVHGDDHGTGVILKDIIDEVDSNYIKVAYDTGNAIFYGEVDPVEDLKASVDVVDYLHIKDKAGDTKEWNFPALGAGDVDFKEIIKVLDKGDNQAPLSIEIEFTEKGPKDLAEINKAVLDSKLHLQSLGIKVGD